jgi:hypothetical protein
LFFDCPSFTVKKEYRFSIFLISKTDFRQKEIFYNCFQKTIVMPKNVLHNYYA